jgi:hypothetical protein
MKPNTYWSQTSQILTPPPGLQLPGQITLVELPIVVDYDRTVDQMLVACHFDLIKSGIKPGDHRFTETGRKNQTAKLLLFDHPISGDTAETLMGTLGKRPGNLEQILAVGEQHPNVQREFGIVALNAILPYNASRIVSLEGDMVTRQLRDHWKNIDYAQLGWRFLAFDL